MFTCENCGKEMPEDKERCIGRLTRFGARILSKTPPPSIFRPRRLCKPCFFAASAAALTAAIAVLAGIALFGVGLCVGVFKQLRNQSDGVLTILSSIVGLALMYFIFLRRRPYEG